MKIKIKRFDKQIPLPHAKTKGSAGIDVYSKEDITIEPHSIAYIPLNIAMQIPQGYFIALVARSSTHKLGLFCANGIGIGDSDFCGDNDEYKFAVYNFTNSPVFVQKGTRIAQILLLKHEHIDFEEVENLGNEDRGGFGSTGHM